MVMVIVIITTTISILAISLALNLTLTPSVLGFGDFSVQNVTHFYGNQDERTTYVVLGDVLNKGLTTDDAEVSLTLYDAYHTIIGVSKVYDDNVPPGEKVPFKFVITGGQVSGGIDNIVNYRIQTQ
jgi:hypothetical protein